MSGPNRNEVSPPEVGGVHKIQILIGDLLKEILQEVFGEEVVGGQGDPDPLMKNIRQTVNKSPLIGPNKGLTRKLVILS